MKDRCRDATEELSYSQRESNSADFQATCELVLISIRRFVTASRAARLAIHESVIAQTNVDDRLAKNAILLAHAVRFGLLALRAFKFCRTGTAHEINVSPARSIGNVTQVTNWNGVTHHSLPFLLFWPPYNSNQ